MNKVVKVSGMQMKSHAEGGLLINEVPSPSSTTWDEEAFAGDESLYTSLRPASTKDLANWWHANSKKSANDAGLTASGSKDGDTVEVSAGKFYTSISPNATGVAKKNFNGSGTGGTNAEKTVYYKDTAYGSGSGTYDDGEGYYVMYKYYIKSSTDTGYTIPAGQFQIQVTASNKSGSGATNSTELDRALSVGVKVLDGINNDYIIFAPVSGADSTYYVTSADTGASSSVITTVNYVAGTGYAALSSSNALTLPKVKDEGMEVDVYLWFEGEDSNCKSDNLTAVLDNYQIDINFKDNKLD